MSGSIEEVRRAARSAQEPCAPPAQLRRAPAPPQPTEVVRVPIGFGGHHVGDLLVRPGTDDERLARAVERLALLEAWSRLGASVAARGTHRLALAIRAAAAAANGAA